MMSLIFMGSGGAGTPPGDAPAPWLALTATATLIAGMALLTVFAGPMMDYAQATARQLIDPAPYVEAVLLRQEGTK